MLVALLFLPGLRAQPSALVSASCAFSDEQSIVRLSSYKLQPPERAFQAAIDAAIASSLSEPTALLFDVPGVHRLASPNASAHEPVLSVTNVTTHGLRIDGCNVSLVVTTPTAGLFSLTDARDLQIGNLTVDYDPLPMTQGFVTAVTSSLEYTLQLEPGFPSLMLPHFLATLGGGWGESGAAWGEEHQSSLRQLLPDLSLTPPHCHSQSSSKIPSIRPVPKSTHST